MIDPRCERSSAWGGVWPYVTNAAMFSSVATMRHETTDPLRQRREFVRERRGSRAERLAKGHRQAALDQHPPDLPEIARVAGDAEPVQLVRRPSGKLHADGRHLTALGEAAPWRQRNDRQRSALTRDLYHHGVAVAGDDEVVGQCQEGEEWVVVLGVGGPAVEKCAGWQPFLQRCHNL